MTGNGYRWMSPDCCAGSHPPSRLEGKRPTIAEQRADAIKDIASCVTGTFDCKCKVAAERGWMIMCMVAFLNLLCMLPAAGTQEAATIRCGPL